MFLIPWTQIYVWRISSGFIVLKCRISLKVSFFKVQMYSNKECQLTQIKILNKNIWNIYGHNKHCKSSSLFHEINSSQKAVGFETFRCVKVLFSWQNIFLFIHRITYYIFSHIFSIFWLYICKSFDLHIIYLCRIFYVDLYVYNI